MGFFHSSDFLLALVDAKRMSAVLLLGFTLFCFPVNESKAMDPVTIATLAAPVAIPIIKAALPYVVKGGVNFSRGMFDMFVDMAGIVMLPVGLFEVSLGAPFGLWRDGLLSLKTGALALPKMFWSMCLVPVKTFGAM